MQSRFSRERVPLLQLGGARRETIDDDRRRLIFSEKRSWVDDREARFLRHDSVCTIFNDIVDKTPCYETMQQRIRDISNFLLE